MNNQNNDLSLLLPLALSLIVHALLVMAAGSSFIHSPSSHLEKQQLIALLVTRHELAQVQESPQEAELSIPGHEVAEASAQKQDIPAPVSPESAPDSAPLPLPGMDFYPTNLLTKKPAALRDIPPAVLDKYPPTIGGSLILTLWINSAGEVVSTNIESSTLPEALADELADEFRQLPFKPGEIRGMPVNTWMRIEVFPQ